MFSEVQYRFGRLIRELRALPMATTPGGENNLLSAIFCPGNTLEGDVSDVIALHQLTSPFSPRKATRMSP